MRLPVLLLALVLMPLAGCSGGGGKDPLSSVTVDESEFEGVEATSTTGVIRGIVVDEAIRPVMGATVTLGGGQPAESTTSDAGAFSFEGLAPGTYFVQVSKAGYRSQQASTDVAAGVSEPPLVRVQLVADPATRPFYEMYQFEGFIACSARYFVEGRNFCGAVDENDKTLFDVDLANGVPTFAQGELVWDSTQQLGDELSFNWRRDDTSTDYIDTEGPSPLVLKANQTLFAQNEVGAGQPLRTVIFTAHNSATEPPCMDPAPCLWGVGVQSNQQFTVYLHVFYNMVPPEDWTFGASGDPPTPGP